MTGQHPAIRMWRAAAEASRIESQARRARVLAHPDLAKRLTEPPLSYTDPARWNGWIPPRTLPEDSCGGCSSGGRCTRDHAARLNDSPFRKALVAIAAEALEREQGTGVQPLDESHGEFDDYLDGDSQPPL